ncbi:cytochrome P460 family protein [Pelagibius marinus]|uniref:cytochrome P460 family protein n=1 Tax=Pelagibius marinus TaxID=2762760 RepID=UPI001872F3AF|nr:cytochrome P460 family protein [Pelagibius marinus]
MTVPKLVRRACLAAALLAIGAGAQPAAAQTATGSQAAVGAEGPAQRFSGPAERPRRHFRVSDPVELSAEEAEEIYLGLRRELARGYAASGDAAAGAYQGWTRFNTAPYGSMTHGRRYVNNYANEIARAYGAPEQAGRFPVGSVIAKDSFVVTDTGDIRPGPLFVMEKMPPGFNYVSGDWRYSVVTAAGELAGRTAGAGAERVEFCIACHLAREAQDHLFFVPEAFRSAP